MQPCKKGLHANLFVLIFGASANFTLIFSFADLFFWPSLFGSLRSQ